MDRIKASEMKDLLVVQDWTKMKDEKRSALWNKLTKATQIPSAKSKTVRPESNEDIANWLRGTLGG